MSFLKKKSKSTTTSSGTSTTTPHYFPGHQEGLGDVLASAQNLYQNGNWGATPQGGTGHMMPNPAQSADPRVAGGAAAGGVGAGSANVVPQTGPADGRQMVNNSPGDNRQIDWSNMFQQYGFNIPNHAIQNAYQNAGIQTAGNAGGGAQPEWNAVEGSNTGGGNDVQADTQPEAPGPLDPGYFQLPGVTQTPSVQQTADRGFADRQTANRGHVDMANVDKGIADRRQILERDILKRQIIERQIAQEQAANENVAGLNQDFNSARGLIQGNQIPTDLSQVAGLQQDTLQAHDMLRNAGFDADHRGRMEEFANRAGQAADYGLEGSKSLMDVKNNPYLEQYMQASINPLTQALNRQIMPGIGSGAEQVGQQGSSRQGIAEGIALGDYINKAGDITSTIGSNAYGQGLNAFTDIYTNTQNNLGQLAGIGSAPYERARQINNEVAGNKLAIGSQLQQHEQAGLDANMMNKLREREMTRQQAGDLVGIGREFQDNTQDQLDAGFRNEQRGYDTNFRNQQRQFDENYRFGQESANENYRFGQDTANEKYRVGQARADEDFRYRTQAVDTNFDNAMRRRDTNFGNDIRRRDTDFDNTQRGYDANYANQVDRNNISFDNQQRAYDAEFGNQERAREADLFNQQNQVQQYLFNQFIPYQMQQDYSNLMFNFPYAGMTQTGTGTSTGKTSGSPGVNGILGMF